MPAAVRAGARRAPARGPGRDARDEFLCDGGDHGRKAGAAGDGSLVGIDPKDAVVGFRDDCQSRVLPTNVVCVYVPQFAAVRVGIGPNETQVVESLRRAEQLQRQEIQALRQGPRRLTQNLVPEIGRHRARPSAAIALVGATRHIEVRVLNGLDQVTHIAGYIKDIGPEIARNRQKFAGIKTRELPGAIKTAESVVVTGVVQAAGEQVMAWKPQEIAGVEIPPNKPGMAVIKQVDAAEAEPGTC